ncbi:MAG TPA: pyridoxine/pyridoxal/pyridoxamine kinase [Ottowia sp.]|uniref:pyridoxine/pyridoxal/pyridoxamine kinase n=1 Tax=Ottowia sp. TaxID=1898956 RepID=UPI002BB53572|nr:pyridoxine/pyridoxal/pyridoxamine kinase [Ottowia sp.]HMN21322.1 pyridoxine/pyridoxal/pyridoxamine kinase [Ottowia sp.]
MNAETPDASALQPLQLDVVSVQSQVVYGRVGNNVALAAFQRHGLTAAAVPTVLLSNTPHYPTLHGGPPPDEWFAGWLEDLVARDCLRRLRLVQLGYLGRAAQAQVLGRWIAARRAALPDLNVLIDPVIGDADVGVYVDPALVQAYREELLGLATGLLPNSFELGTLTGAPVQTLEQVLAAARGLLQGRTRWVVVTSAAPREWPRGRMRVAVVSAHETQVIEHERVDAAPKGTGDLFSATLGARLLAGASLAEAAQAACDAVVAAVALTHRAGCAELLLPA